MCSGGPQGPPSGSRALSVPDAAAVSGKLGAGPLWGGVNLFSSKYRPVSYPAFKRTIFPHEKSYEYKNFSSFHCKEVAAVFKDLFQATLKGHPPKKAEKYPIIFIVKRKTTAENPTEFAPNARLLLRPWKSNRKPNYFSSWSAERHSPLAPHSEPQRERGSRGQREAAPAHPGPLD
ncbi:hypothetical protein DBR06_SOUSAS12510037 [Sousa chinensis]|nr:hypothetical protein DBR06_SOUSAS12510037 [Sousa chinensis]